MKIPKPVILKPFQVTLDETRGDTARLIKKFGKKVRKAEILKPYYEKLTHFTSKSDIRRAKRAKAIWEEKKRRLKEE